MSKLALAVQRKPEWFKVGIPGEGSSNTFAALQSRHLNTVCEEALCPNRAKCWSSGTATFLLLGKVCTRNCLFCAVKSAREGEPLDEGEPDRIASAAKEMGLKYVVLTSVDRDDLPDLGAGHFAECIRAVRSTGALVEALIPDFQGREDCLEKVLEAEPRVLGHNIEVVRRLQRTARDARASYKQSLELLHNVKVLKPRMFTKSSIMLGLGETREEVLEAMDDLRQVKCDFLTLGQYLQPTKGNIPVVEFVSPAVFKNLGEEGLRKGFKYVASGPLVRSSFMAWDFFERQSGV